MIIAIDFDGTCVTHEYPEVGKDIGAVPVLKRLIEKGHQLNEPQLNGIACPKCGEELYDSTPMMTLTSMPPKKNVHCGKCDYVGYRTA